MKKRTKILFVITKSNFGGAQRYVYDLARSLPQKDYEVVVAAGDGKLLKKNLDDANIRIISILGLARDINVLKEFLSFFSMIFILFKERPYIVHLNSSKAGAMGAFVARLAFIQRIIFTAHGWAFNEERPLWQKKIITFFHWLTIIFSHKTIAVSHTIRDQIIHLPFIKNKIVVIHNGANQSVLYSKEEARELFLKHKPEIKSISKQAIWIGTISELHRTKGLTYAIEAVERLISEELNVVLFIAGDGDRKNELRRIIKERGLTDKVFLLGFVISAEQYLKAFDIFTLTSTSEALGLTILEAGLAERPVVASNVGGIPEIISHERSGLLVEPRNPHAIFKALKKLIENPKLQKELGQNLKNKVKEKFLLDKMTKSTIKIYQS